MNQWIAIMLVAATYIGTVIGAGFATGKEIVTFFSNFGVLGTIGIFISCYLLTFFGTKIMLISAKIEAYSYKEFNEYIFGKIWGRLINAIIFIIVMSVTSVMLSGAGAVFHEQLGIPYLFGVIMTITLVYFVVLKGLNGLFAINAYIVPLIILFGIFIFISLFSENPIELLSPLFMLKIPSNSFWIISPFTYASFNIITALVVLVPLGKEMKDERVLKWGGFFGGLGLFILLLLSHFSLLVNPGTFPFDIPMAEIVKQFGRFIHVLFLIIIFSEIFNTVTANVYGISRQLKMSFGLRNNHSTLIVLLIIFLVSQQYGYGQLLSILYPIFGYVGLIYLAFILFKKVPQK
ncbi:YkvI family membrane protein [Ornithinibacillus halotolerans]|uniref:Membrane protein n=1 Tax=Ornithinibacillus halotolerans TaxID=1274357 RepID=A0A916W6Y5_9BACI|nr:hypothetical protein [Ornithinibacillus halotolerans]GGA71566.1 membrane protein [Ornithinibacillus halotolerans]